MQALILLSTSNKNPETKNTIMKFIKTNSMRIYKWLANGEHDQWAIECAPNSQNIDLASLRKNAEPLGLDINSVNHENRRKKLLLADMDSTLIKGESLNEIANKAGVGEEVAKITSQTMHGELNFEQSVIHRVSLLKNVGVAVLEKVVKETSFNAGALLLAPIMKKNGAFCYILSGGFDFLTNQISKEIGFDGSFSNSLEVKNSKLTGNIIPPIFGKQAKLETLISLTNKHNLSFDSVVAIGDGANDLEMLKKAGLGIAFKGKPKLKSEIKTQLNYTNLTGLLFLQGYDIKDIYDSHKIKI